MPWLAWCAIASVLVVAGQMYWLWARDIDSTRATVERLQDVPFWRQIGPCAFYVTVAVALWPVLMVWGVVSELSVRRTRRRGD